MRITLNEPELELEVNRVDTPTGTGWCVIMPDDRKILVKLRYGKWETEDMISEQFVQDVGSEISRFLEEDQPGRVNDSYSALNTRAKRARIPKYILI
jgi:hypothetical protein